MYDVYNLFIYTSVEKCYHDYSSAVMNFDSKIYYGVIFAMILDIFYLNYLLTYIYI